MAALDKIHIDESDDILFKQIEYIRKIASPERKIVQDAKSESKLGHHAVALQLFRKAIQRFPQDVDLNNQFAWELSKEGKLLLEQEPFDLTKIKQVLAEYIKLHNDPPPKCTHYFSGLQTK